MTRPGLLLQGHNGLHVRQVHFQTRLEISVANWPLPKDLNSLGFDVLHADWRAEISLLTRGPMTTLYHMYAPVNGQCEMFFPLPGKPGNFRGRQFPERRSIS